MRQGEGGGRDWSSLRVLFEKDISKLSVGVPDDLLTPPVE